MLTYTFEEKQKKPYYQFLYESVKQDILEGVLKEGEKLPSKRNFAKQLGLSVMTIETAYEQLLVEGYIYAIEKKGYYVAEIHKQGLDWVGAGYNGDAQKEAEEIAGIRQEHSGMVKENGKEYLMDFSTNQVEKKHFPMATWAKLMRGVLNEAPEAILMPPPSAGVWQLREAIAEHLARFRGMKVSPEQVVVGAGTEYLYHILIQLLGRDYIYGMEDPGYQKLSYIYGYNNVKFQTIGIDRQGLSVEELSRSQVNVIHTSPTHHFPTGAVMPIGRRQSLLEWARHADDRFIIEDDYDCEFRFGGMPIPTLQSIDQMGRVIYVNTFSKSMTPSIRISYMVLPMPLLRRYEKHLSFYANTVANFEQYTLARFLKEGYFEKHINRMRNFYRNQRSQVIDLFRSSVLWHRCHLHEDDAGLHFLLKIDSKMEDHVLLDALDEKGIRMRALSDYSRNPKEEYKQTFIINYTGIDISKLAESLTLMEETICQLETDAK